MWSTCRVGGRDGGRGGVEVGEGRGGGRVEVEVGEGRGGGG